VEELHPERSLAHTPFFQVMFSLQAAGAGALPRLGDAGLELLDTGAPTVRFDLSLTLAGDGDGVRGVMTYRAALFDGATVERMLEHYAALLEAVAAEPDRALEEVTFLGDAERRRVLEEWNDTATDFADLRPVHQRFAEQAARTPRAPAIVFGEEVVSYAEVDARANRLAHHLRALGVRTDARVGLFLERSADAVVSLFAVLRSGGAYVALDPSYPDERLRAMLADSGALAVVTRASLAERVASFAGAVVRVDADADAIAARPAGAPNVSVSPENLAYVIYTSGSTGTPKGVLTEHRGLSNYLAWFGSASAGEAGCAVPLVSRLSFDAHVRQLFPPLLRGDAAWVLPEETVADPKALLDTLSTRARVSFGGVPSLWAAMVEAIHSGEAAPPPGLVALRLGGEALPAELLERTRALFPGIAIWNHYGPTEATVNISAVRVEDGRPTLGRPIANVRAYALDARLRPVPVGIPGELYAGGAGVARGYLGRPALTAERFLPDPHGRPGARMYRTGDRARWTAGGALEYLGRADQQVKVRGFRIEPGEVEAALERHPSVRRAVVVAREDQPGRARLVGYLVAEAGAVPSTAEVKAFLKERLPEYMVPSALVALAALPLTPTGKLDVRALPAPDPSAHGEAYVAPRTPAEERLAAIFAGVLKAERVGAGDDFFELGGHSLLATRLVSRVREAFGVELPLRALFESPTVEGLAARVEALAGENAGPGAPPLVPVSRDGVLPLSFAQARLWFIDQLEPGSAAYNIPYALRLRGRVDAGVLERVLTETVRRHEALRTRFASVGGEPAQVIDPAGPVRLTLADLAGLSGDEREAAVRELAEAEARRPFDLAAGPLLRSTLARVGNQEHVLLFTLHHIVSDGWSTGILVREVSALYDAFARGLPSPLPELPVQYADFAAWQRAWLAGEVLDAQLGWWKERLAGAPPLLELPTDRPRPPAPDNLGASRPFALSEELSRGLAELSRREGATLFMTLLAAFQALLGRYAGQDEVVVGSPIAGRTRAEVEGLIGFFANTLPLRTDLSGDPAFRELLGRVREASLGAYAHQDVPFERLVEELQPERTLAHSPLFQVMFLLLNTERGGLAMGEVEIEPVEIGSATAKFDLLLGLAEQGGRIGGAMEFRTELFDAATIDRMLGHLRTLLEAAVRDPGARISRLPLLGADERARVVEEWNATAAGYPAERCVHDLFAAAAARTPHAPAIVFRGETVTFRALDERSNRLARHLRRLGVGPDSRVGISLERGPEMMAAVLGVLKAGGAYVPVDPAYPAERIAYMLADSAAPVLLTQSSLVDALPATDAVVVRMDADAEAIAAECAEPFASGALPDHLAYVIYTSGSTGRPKGVAMTHRPLVNMLAWQEREWKHPAAAATLQFTTLSFDVSFQEIFSCWLSGGRLVLVSEDERRDFAAVLERLDGEGIERLFLPYVALQHLAEVAEERGIAPRALREVAPRRRTSSPASCTRAASAPGARLPGRRALALTAERFVPDPFSASPARGCTAPATARAGGPTASWSSWAAPTSR
jgi:amino acid adenylation domain-containing protein